jgi:hypothetical protein
LGGTAGSAAADPAAVVVYEHAHNVAATLERLAAVGPNQYYLVEVLRPGTVADYK